jgi:hypothetical protein
MKGALTKRKRLEPMSVPTSRSKSEVCDASPSDREVVDDLREAINEDTSKESTESPAEDVNDRDLCVNGEGWPGVIYPDC